MSAAQSAGSPQRDRFPVVVHTLLLRGGSVLLLRRRNTGVGDGLYQPPGGYQQAGESVTAAAIRECREEAGVDVAATHLVPACVLPYAWPGGQGIDFVFVAETFTGEGVIGEPDRCDDARWFPLTALPETCVPFLAVALDCRARGRWFHEVGF
jgi:ADP-ribose pyrophosphatase YjhB (NUDIX family)